MEAVILAAGYGTRLGELGKRMPKALLPVGGKPVIAYLLESLAACGIERGVLVTNARFADSFARYFEGGKPPVSLRLVNDGSTEPENRLGAVRDLALALEHVKEGQSVFVSASDNIFTDPFDRLIERYRQVRCPVIALIPEEDPEVLKRSGVAHIAPDGRLISFVEKPVEPQGRYATPPLYLYPPDIRRDIADFLSDPAYDHDAPGNLVSFLVKRRPVYGVVLRGRRYDIGSLQSYEEAKRAFS